MIRAAAVLAAGLAAAPAAAERVAAAAFAEPTARYGHLVLGRAHNFAALRVETDAGRALVLRHSRMVFEDTAPRLADVDGDGAPEVVAVESDPDLGARVAVFGLDGAGLARRGATFHVGRPNRWYAVAAVADLDGDGAVEIAFVDRPHLARVLRVWRWTDGALREVAALEGVTNHRIGAPDIAGGLRDCGAGPEIVLASADWSRRVVVRLADGALVARDAGPWTGDATC